MKKGSILLILSGLLFIGCKEASVSTNSDPLPSWNEGPTKTAIISFVSSVSNEGNAQYISPEERIATFDNDGTLWCEQPVPQLEFVVYQIKKLAGSHPEWKNKQPFKSVLENDKNYLINDLVNNHGKELIELFKVTHAGISLEEFNTDVITFFNNTVHEKYKNKYTETVYQPMLELLDYLRDNNFKTYICSGGGNDFMRVFSEEVYGVVPENVIGSFAMNSFEKIDGKWEIIKKIDNFFMNDKGTKPAAIVQRIGRIPVFVAGNVRSGGDIGQLTYSQTNTLPNFQLLVNHDDAIREYEYVEKNNASLIAAEDGKWHVVSMKNDWRKIFPFEN